MQGSTNLILECNNYEYDKCFLKVFRDDVL